jgi:hypothetical protein
MHLPATWTARFPWLARLSDDWQPVSRRTLLIACAFYGLFLVQIARGSGLLLIIDLALVPVHEGGHLFFQWFGEFLGIAGGTIFQLGVPLILTVFFEQFLPVGTYMEDARAQELPLISVGDSDDVIHDWNYLFGRLGVLSHDSQIAHAVRVIGWMGMVATVVWMVWRSLQTDPSPATAVERSA